MNKSLFRTIIRAMRQAYEMGLDPYNSRDSYANQWRKDFWRLNFDR